MWQSSWQAKTHTGTSPLHPAALNTQAIQTPIWAVLSFPAAKWVLQASASEENILSARKWKSMQLARWLSLCLLLSLGLWCPRRGERCCGSLRPPKAWVSWVLVAQASLAAAHWRRGPARVRVRLLSPWVTAQVHSSVCRQKEWDRWRQAANCGAWSPWMAGFLSKNIRHTLEHTLQTCLASPLQTGEAVDTPLLGEASHVDAFPAVAFLGGHAVSWCLSCGLRRSSSGPLQPEWMSRVSTVLSTPNKGRKPGQHWLAGFTLQGWRFCQPTKYEDRYGPLVTGGTA